MELIRPINWLDSIWNNFVVRDMSTRVKYKSKRIDTLAAGYYSGEQIRVGTWRIRDQTPREQRNL